MAPFDATLPPEREQLDHAASSIVRAAPGAGMPTMSMPIMPTTDAAVVTVGVVVDLPEPWCTELREWRSYFGDEHAGVMRPHVTLLPPTAVGVGHLEDIEAHLRQVAQVTPAFSVSLRGTDSFRPISPVVFVRLAEGAEPLEAVQRRIRSGPLTRELDYPFHPHVTVAQNVAEDVLDLAFASLSGYAADFPVESMGLYQHDAHGKWQLRVRLDFTG